MTPAERKQLERDRRKAGLVRLDMWVPADKLDAIKAEVQRIVGEPTNGIATDALK